MAYIYKTIDQKQVEANVAVAFEKLAAAFKRQFGLTLHIRSGTRTQAKQEELYRLYRSGKGNLAAKPGTSLHEESNPRGPRALDIYDSGSTPGVTRAGNVRSNWLKRNARAFQFDPAGYRFSQTEPWHIEYTGTFATPPKPPATNPFGITNVKGLQVLARANGGDTELDNKWGSGSQSGFATFLRRKWGYSGNDVFGPNMRAAMARWLRKDWGYVGFDVLGPNMRAALSKANSAHEKYGVSGKPSAPAPSPSPAPVVSNPFGLTNVRGLQKIANLYGAKTKIDNKWGPKSAAGFAEFLRAKWGYAGNDILGPNMWKAIARWLRSRWGYSGNDTPGPNMRAALVRAEIANNRELK